jgi:hypothetical protein
MERIEMIDLATKDGLFDQPKMKYKEFITWLRTKEGRKNDLGYAYNQYAEYCDYYTFRG